MRERLIHGYDAVDIDELWKTAAEDVPALLEQVRTIQAARISGSDRLAALENVPSLAAEFESSLGFGNLAPHKTRNKTVSPIRKLLKRQGESLEIAG